MILMLYSVALNLDICRRTSNEVKSNCQAVDIPRNTGMKIVSFLYGCSYSPPGDLQHCPLRRRLEMLLLSSAKIWADINANYKSTSHTNRRACAHFNLIFSS